MRRKAVCKRWIPIPDRIVFGVASYWHIDGNTTLLCLYQRQRTHKIRSSSSAHAAEQCAPLSCASSECSLAWYRIADPCGATRLQVPGRNTTTIYCWAGIILYCWAGIRTFNLTIRSVLLWLLHAWTYKTCQQHVLPGG